MNKKLISLSMLCVIFATAMTGCEKDRGETNDEEVITTMTLTFTPTGGGTPLRFSFDDPDGPGGAVPVQDQISLEPSTSYDVSVQLLNKTASPVEDVTEEVSEEGAAHRFYYTPSGAAGITVGNLNNDSNGTPLGITSRWTTAATGSGQVTVTLRHYPAEPPNKQAADQVDDNKSGTDIEVEFETVIE